MPTAAGLRQNRVLPGIRVTVRLFVPSAAIGTVAAFGVAQETNLARDISDEVLMFDSGRVIESGSPERIFSGPHHERTREFLGAVL
ncbi:hypothetical protein GCM10010249_45820 [Streptomyces roseolilacinus]|uniref:ABC transporter ATP-binding protein n=1 Tax=Streptomyces roseolilacinus TaxID=66904 RepID=A0A918ELI4_9ACTN|nr:hypothetical protein GCM10010249_45820 [Streptomyces roseolilacinus]